MKKIFKISAILIITILSVQIFAVDKNIDGKIGTAYASGPQKMGLDVELDYFYELDPFFAIGASTGMFWLQWSKKLSSEEASSTNLNLSKEETFNAFMIPFLAQAQVRLPNFKESIGITPYFGGGLGFSMMSYSYFNGEKDVVDWFSGFTWIINAGVAYSPSASSNIEFLGQLGYRGAKLNMEDRTADMSGVGFFAGVRYLISSRSAY
ncbi:MAG: outer membrane beta-barrel protein [Spirochaetes bacterium]|nr:outer membrane beta-barrel protein [Spirochaetota bacterium]